MADPKTPKGERTKSRIVEASIKLINENGFENTTLNDMCREAGVAPGTFYHYFTSMNDIFLEIIRIEGENLLEYSRQLGNITPLEKLRRILDYQYAYFERKGREVVAYIYQAEFTSINIGNDIEKLLPLRDIIAEIIRDGQLSGLFNTSATPEQRAVTIVSAILYYSIRWLKYDPERLLSELIDEYMTSLLNEILTE